MVWQMINDGKDDCEGYQVYCPLDGKSCGVLSQYAGRMLVNPSGDCFGRQLSAALVAPGSIASLFGSNSRTARRARWDRFPRNSRVSMSRLVDGLGQSHNASLFFASPSQINLLVPAGCPGRRSGGAESSATEHSQRAAPSTSPPSSRASSRPLPTGKDSRHGLR